MGSLSRRASLLFAAFPPIFACCSASAATLDISGGSLTYTASPGIDNNFSVSSSGPNFIIIDTGETIMLSPAAIATGWSGSGSNTVIGPNISVTVTFTVNLLDGNDTLVINAGIALSDAMTLESGGSISEGGSGTIAAATLSVGAGTNAALSSNNSVNQFTALVGGNLEYVNFGSLTVPVSGLNAGGALELTLNEPGATLSVGGTVQGASITLEASGAILPIPGRSLISGTNLAMRAGGVIGTLAAPLVTNIAAVAANTSNGSICLVNNNSGAPLNIGFAGETVEGVTVTGTNADISISNTGSIYIAGTDIVQGSGNIAIQAVGPTADLQVAGQTAAYSISGTGNGTVLVTAGRDLSLGNNTGYGLISSDNSIVLTAGRNLTMNSNSGVVASGAIQVSANNNITLTTATGTATGPLFIDFGGSITLSTAPGGAFTEASNRSTATATVGNITITADSMTFTNEISAKGIVTLQPSSPRANIALGGTNAPGTLGLTDAELALITAGGGLIIGSTSPVSTGGITIESPITPHAGYSTLTLETAGNFIGMGVPLSAMNLVLTDLSATGRSWTITDLSVIEGTNPPIALAHPNSLTVNGGKGSATFTVSPSFTTTFTLNGNLPGARAFPGNALNLTALKNANLNITSDNANGMAGSYTFTGGSQPVAFAGIQSGLFAAPAIATAFGASAIGLNTSTILTFTLSQLNPTPVTGLASLTGVTFTDLLPAGLVAAAVSSNNCGGSISGATTLVLSNAGVPVNGFCNIIVNVVGASAGTMINTSSVVSAIESGTGSVSGSATLTVTPAIEISALTATYPNTGVATVTVVTNSGNPTGNITLSIDGIIATNQSLNASGRTAFTLPVLSAGTHSLGAAYSAGNFANASGLGSATINKAVLTVTANNTSKLYGAPLPAFSAILTGFVNGDTAATAVAGSPGFTTSAGAASAAGNYPITPTAGSLAAMNYSFTFVNGTLTVTHAVLTVTANNVSKVYGASLPPATATITGFVNSDTQASATTGAPVVTTTATARSPVGSYPITAVQGTLAATNYSFLFVNGLLTVTPAVLTVTANNAVNLYGSSLPAFTFTITGFVNGDTQATATTGAAGLTTTASARSPVGTYPITAAQGTLAATNYSFTFAAGTLTINKAGTVTTLVNNHGVLLATVSPVLPGAGTPTGATQFVNGTTSLGTVTLVGSIAAINASPGTVTAIYSGDSNFMGSTSGQITVSPAVINITLASSINPSPLGQAVTFIAAVNVVSSPNGAAPTGTVQFLDAAKSLATVVLSGGQANYTTSFLSGGTHTITTQYSGDITYPGAQATFVQTVIAPITMTLTSPSSALVYGQPVTLTVNVGATTPPGLSPPTGQVTFVLQGSNPAGTGTSLGIVPLTSGTATITLNSLPAGANYITVSYGGDATWPPVSRQLTVAISQAPTITSLSLTLVAGQFVLTAVVAPQAPATGTPSGAVQFVDTSNHNKVVASVTLSSGKASAQVASAAALTAGGRPIAAIYSGDANFSSGISMTLPAVVNSASYTYGSVAPNEILSVFDVAGINGNTSTGLSLATSLAGSSASLTDSAETSRPMPLYGAFASTGQINLVVPDGTAFGPALLSILTPGGAVTTVVNVAGIAPGIFTTVQSEQGVFAGQVVYAHADGTQTIVNSTANPIQFSTPTDQIFLILFGTGLRNGASLTATLNGTAVPVSYFGPQTEYPGLDQINLGPLPTTLVGAGLVPIAIAVDGQSANVVTASIQ
jgi:hypothetical protein